MATDKNNTSKGIIKAKANTKEIMIESIKIDKDIEIINRQIVMVDTAIIKEVKDPENMVDIEKISIKRDTIKPIIKRISSNRIKKPQLLSNLKFRFQKLRRLLNNLKSL